MKSLLLLTLAICISVASMGQLGTAAKYSGGDDFIIEMGVYPNPSTTGEFTVEFVSTNPKQDIYIKVYTLIGKEVHKQKISAAEGRFKENFTVGHLPKGVYLLEVSNGDRKQTRRLSYM